MTSIEEILQGCKSGNPISQEKLYKQFYPALFALCNLFFDDNHDTLTALNNGMLRVYKNIHQFDESKGTLFNWMYTTIRNAALSYLTVKKNVYKNIELPEDINVEGNDYNLNNFETKDVRFCLQQLPLATRNVCRLNYLDGLNIKEIAAALNISTGTVKWHLSEGRKKLKPILEKHYTIFAGA